MKEGDEEGDNEADDLASKLSILAPSRSRPPPALAPLPPALAAALKGRKRSRSLARSILA